MTEQTFSYTFAYRPDMLAWLAILWAVMRGWPMPLITVRGKYR